MSKSNQPFFIESIKVLDGEFYNIELHIERMRRTLFNFFKRDFEFSINKNDIPLSLQKGLVKCRIVYSLDSVDVGYEPYLLMPINSFSYIENNAINYSYKYLDRELINQLYSQKGDRDEIIIVRNGFITDTSRSNLVFENERGLYTPSTYLLNGIKRQWLLSQNRVKEVELKVSDLAKYQRAYLINAMIDIEDNISVELNR